MNLLSICNQAKVVVNDAATFIQTQYAIFEAGKVQTKSLNSFVSYVDVESEKILVSGLSEILHGSGFLTEEATTPFEQKEYIWIIDPLDGTTNFIHQVPVFSISVALYHYGEAVLGIVWDVMHKECFYATKGGGAYMNSKPIAVSAKSKLADCLIATGFPYEVFDYRDKYLNAIKELMPRCRGIRRLGSAAIDLAYTACGRFDAFFEYNLNAWDVAGGALIVQEAGGVVSDFVKGKDFITRREILASNGSVHQAMLEIIGGEREQGF